MKNFNHPIQLLAILFSLLSCNHIFGQEDALPNTKFGLGASLFNIYDYSIDRETGTSIYMTIDLSNKLRLEPTIGFAFSEENFEFAAGIGVFGKKAISKFNTLYGLRARINSNDAIILAPTIGGEYYFIKNFSVGSEINLNGMINEGNWVIFTNAAVLVRFYF
jgi:hypothetical protein